MIHKGFVVKGHKPKSLETTGLIFDNVLYFTRLPCVSLNKKKKTTNYSCQMNVRE